MGFAKAPPATQTQRITGLQISDSALGQTIPYVIGHCKTAHKLIYYSNFQAHSYQQSKKGGTNYWYSVNADFILGYGPFESIVSAWENGTWYYSTYSSQTFTGSGTGTQFNFTINNNTSTIVSVMGVAYNVSFSNSYNDYVDPFTTNSFSLSGTSFLPLYNAYFPLPNYGNISLSTLPYAFYNADPGDEQITVIFPAAVTNPQVKVYYAEVGGNNAAPQTTSGKKGGGNIPYQVGGLVFERVLGSGSAGNPIIYPEFSGDSGANIPLGSSATLPSFNYEVKGLFGLGNSSPVSTYNPGAAPGDPGQYLAKTASGDCCPADIICDLICSGNREPGDVNFIWQHGLGFSSYIPGPTDAYWAYSRYGGILKDEPSIAGTGTVVTHIYTRPTAFQQTGSGYQNPTNAYDNNPATYSLGTPDSSGNAVGCNWDGLAAGTVGQATYLRVLNNITAQVGGAGSLRYSIDNGANFITMYTFQEQQGTTATRGLQIDSAIIPPGTSQSNIIVRAESHPGDHTGGYCWSYIYEIYLDQVTFSPAVGTGSLGLSNLRDYCMAYNIFISGTMDSQATAASVLSDLAKVSNSAPVFDGAALDFIPYCEISSYGNGTNYVAPSSTGPLFNLTSNDFLPVKGKAPVELDYDRASNNFNSLQVGFKDARAQWTDNFIIISDSMDITVQGGMNSTQLNFNYLTNAETAQAVGYPLLRRTLLVDRKEYKFSLPGVWSTILTPMDLVTLSEPTLSPYQIPVRITTTNLTDKFELQVTAEPFIYGSSSPLVPGATGSAQEIQNPGNGNNDPGNVNTPIIFEAVPGITATPQLWLCVSGVNPYWGGAIVWMSTNGGVTYSEVGIATGRQTMGLTSTSTYPSHADPDSANTLFVDLTESLGNLFSVSSSQQDQFFPSLCYLEGGGTVTDPNGNVFTIPYELVAFQVATLTAPNAYEMGAATTTPVRRSILGTPAASHPSGSDFSFLSDNVVVKIDLPQNLIGTLLYFKFTSFNIQGGNGQSISDVSAYTFTPTGQVGFLQPSYAITPQPTIYQGQPGGWSGVDGSSSTWTNTGDIYFPPITATFTSGKAIKYAARDAGIAIFTVSGGGETAWITIYDPGVVGDFGASSQLNTFADLNQTRWNSPGYIRVGTLTSKALSGGGGGGSGGGGGTNPGGADDTIMYVPIAAGTYVGNQELFYAVYPRTVTFPVNLTGTIAGCRVNPASTAVLTLKKNGSSIGTISISTAGVATITFASSVTFNGTTDSFSIAAPSVSDTTFAGFFISIFASRSN